jgi:hypothetical protein
MLDSSAEHPTSLGVTTPPGYHQREDFSTAAGPAPTTPASWTLTVEALSNPPYSEIWFDTIAHAVDPPKTELQRQIKESRILFRQISGWPV